MVLSARKIPTISYRLDEKFLDAFIQPIMSCPLEADLVFISRPGLGLRSSEAFWVPFPSRERNQQATKHGYDSNQRRRRRPFEGNGSAPGHPALPLSSKQKWCRTPHRGDTLPERVANLKEAPAARAAPSLRSQ